MRHIASLLGYLNRMSLCLSPVMGVEKLSVVGVAIGGDMVRYFIFSQVTKHIRYFTTKMCNTSLLMR